MSELHKDITWRLRNTRWQGTEWASLMFEAADEIERLRKDLAIAEKRFDDTMEFYPHRSE